MQDVHTWADAPAPQNEAPSPSFVAPLAQPLNAMKANDSDEWEYEYSATETETFYLTLDLTTPSIPTSRPRIPALNNGRGGFRAKWINPGLGRHKRQLGRPPTISLPTKDVGDGTPADSADEDAPASPDPEALQLAEPGNEGDACRQERIQILDLDSDNPLISYRDHVFTCQWAKNIGTELLFASRDENAPLPTLRRLPADVDLLGACSARITSSTATLVPVAHAAPLEAPQEPDGPLVESVSAAASDDRRKQARFLERLMRIKDKKQERDEVTVVAYKRLRFQGWVDLLRKRREEERAGLRQKLWSSTRAEAEEAQRRLAELDEEERNMPKEAPVGEEDDEEDGGERVVKRRRRRRKDVLTEGAEAGGPSMATGERKKTTTNRRPRGDWKRYNLDGTIAGPKPAQTGLGWRGVDAQDAADGGWNAWPGNNLGEENAEADVSAALDMERPAGLRQDGLEQQADMEGLRAPGHAVAPELLVPPGGWTGLLEGDDDVLPPPPGP